MTCKVLIVEDEEDIREALAMELEFEAQYECMTADDQEAALQILKGGFKPHVILTDIMMPSGQDAGLQLIQAIKSHASWKFIPVIVLSAKTQSGMILEALRLGAIDYLIKPWNLTELVGRIERAYTLMASSYSEVETDVEREGVEKRWRELHTELMQHSLLYWETSGNSKVELADESGLWISTLDGKGTFRTKTLDRYLNIKTLPKNPQTHRVIHTAKYVLQHASHNELIGKTVTSLLQELDTLTQQRET